SDGLTSVVLPVHDQGGHIRTLVSEYVAALARSRIEWEIVLVPNACRDGSDEICAALAAEHAGIRSVAIEQGGWGRAVRRARREATSSAPPTPPARRRRISCCCCCTLAPFPASWSRRTARSASTGRAGSARCSTTSSAERSSTSRAGTSTARPRCFRAHSATFLPSRATTT